jgi:hypothetical protein
MPTKQILQQRASTLFASIPKVPIRAKKERKEEKRLNEDKEKNS